MCGGRQAGQDSCVREEETAGADGQECAFLLRVLLLHVREGTDEAQRLGLRLQDSVGAAARDDQDVEFGEAGVGFLEVDVGAEAGALFRGSVLGEGDEGRGEGFGGWGKMGSALSAVRRRGLEGRALQREMEECEVAADGD